MLLNVVMFCLVEFVISDYELAHSRPAIQSGTDTRFSASRAVDGDSATYSLAAVDSNSTEGGWWQVDLGDIYKISRVTVVNSNSDFEHNSLSSFAVLVGSTDTSINNGASAKCFEYLETTPAAGIGGTYSMTCMQQPTVGRYVTIRRMPAVFTIFRIDMIALAEVYVYSNEIVTDICHNKPAIQNKTFDNSNQYAASKAVDGDLLTCSFLAVGGGSTAIAWWQVDLGAIYAVTSVVIVNTDDALFQAYQYMTAFVVFLDTTSSTDDPTDSSIICYAYPDDGVLYVTSKKPMSLTCQRQPLRGRYLTMRRRPGSDGRQDAMGVCEIYAFGVLSDMPPATTSTSTSSTSRTSTTTTTTTTTSTTTTLRSTPTTTTTTATTTTSPTTTSTATTTTTTNPLPPPTTQSTTATTTTTSTTTSKPTTTSSSPTPQSSSVIPPSLMTRQSSQSSNVTVERGSVTSTQPQISNDTSLASARDSSQSPDWRMYTIIVGGILGFIVLVAVIIIACLCRRIHSLKQSSGHPQTEDQGTGSKEAEPSPLNGDKNQYTHLKRTSGASTTEQPYAYSLQQVDNPQPKYTPLDFNQREASNVITPPQDSTVTNQRPLPIQPVGVTSPYDNLVNISSHHPVDPPIVAPPINEYEELPANENVSCDFA